MLGHYVAKRRAWPTLESLGEIEAAALDSCPPGTRLEVVVMEPTGPASMPIAVFFATHGHVVHRVARPGARSAPFLSRHTKTNGIDTDTLARLPFDPAGLRRSCCPGGTCHAGWSGAGDGSAPEQGAVHKRRIKDLTRQLMPMTPLNSDLGVADLAVLNCRSNALVRAGEKQLTTLIAKASDGPRGVDRPGS